MSTNSKIYEKPSPIVSPTANNRQSILRSSTIAVTPTVSLPPASKIEKDIVKHATRIRTRHIRESFLRQQAYLSSQTTDYLTHQSISQTRFSPPNKRTKLINPSKSIALVSLDNPQNKNNIIC